MAKIIKFPENIEEIKHRKKNKDIINLREKATIRERLNLENCLMEEFFTSYMTLNLKENETIESFMKEAWDDLIFLYGTEEKIVENLKNWIDLFYKRDINLAKEKLEQCIEIEKRIQSLINIHGYKYDYIKTIVVSELILNGRKENEAYKMVNFVINKMEKGQR